MTSNTLLLERNRKFAESFSHGEIPALPKLGTMILTCIDARVDPAHVLGLDLGDAVVFRNNGGRVTQAFIDEVSALSILVARMTGAEEASFNIVLMEHTKCGAQAFADAEFRTFIKDRINVDVSVSAVTDQETDLRTDIGRLRDAPYLPGSLTVSTMLYDVDTGTVTEMAKARSLADLRAEKL